MNVRLDGTAVINNQLPGSPFELSVVGFGCWAIGGKWWGPVDDDESKRAVSHAVDIGINWFDTAPLYGHGHADRILVEALGSRRHDVVIATKFGPRWDDSEHAACDLSATNVRRDIEESLKRLELETIPLVQAHWACERGTPLAETLDTLDALKDEGKIRHYGLCNYAKDEAIEAHTRGGASLQRAYSMIRRELEPELDALKGANVGLLVYETLGRGLLTGKFLERPDFPESDMRKRDDRFAEPAFTTISGLVEALRIVARRIDSTPAAIAIAWAIAQSGATSAIVGAKTEAQVDENVAAVELLGRRKLWEALGPYVDHCRV